MTGLDLNERCETIKLGRGGKVVGGFGDGFLDLSLGARVVEAKTKKCDFIRLKASAQRNQQGQKAA